MLGLASRALRRMLARVPATSPAERSGSKPCHISKRQPLSSSHRHTHVLSMHVHCTTDDSLRERGPYSHTIRAGTVSPICLTFPTLWLSVVSRLKVSPCQVHHVYTPRGARSRTASQVRTEGRLKLYVHVSHGPADCE